MSNRASGYALIHASHLIGSKDTGFQPTVPWRNLFCKLGLNWLKWRDRAISNLIFLIWSLLGQSHIDQTSTLLQSKTVSQSTPVPTGIGLCSILTSHPLRCGGQDLRDHTLKNGNSTGLWEKTSSECWTCWWFMEICYVCTSWSSLKGSTLVLFLLAVFGDHFPQQCCPDFQAPPVAHFPEKFRP